MIAVTFALPAESSAFVRRLENRRREGGIVRGEIKRQTSNIEHRTSNVCVVHTGVGAHRCEKLLGAYFARERPRLLVSSGFCGGTSDALVPGDLLVGENYSDATLARTARSALTAIAKGKLFSADHVVDPSADRYKIGRKEGALAIDMETHVIARLCALNDVRMLSLRIVSDSPAAPFPAPPDVLFDEQKQRTDLSSLLKYLACHPAATIRLLKFSRQVAMAREKIADALCALIGLL